MAHVRYKGFADVRELTAADMQHLGVEGFSKTRFNRFEATEVDKNFVEALVNTGEFEEVSDEDAKAEAEAPADLSPEPTDTGASSGRLHGAMGGRGAGRARGSTR